MWCINYGCRYLIFVLENTNRETDRAKSADKEIEASIIE